MVGILLVTHNGLGDSLLDCVRHVTGKLPGHLRTVSVLADDDPQLKEQEVRNQVNQLNAGEGVLILTDLYGATPCNIARRVCAPGLVEGVAGVNLPMLLRVACGPDLPLADMLQRATQGGKDCIVPLNGDTADCKVCNEN
jgi:mannose PTS system EIIA component